MKKTYVKPMIVFEDFKISSNIANSCETRVSANKNTCGITVGNITYFALEGVCTTDGDNLDPEFCQHVPLEDNRLFGS